MPDPAAFGVSFDAAYLRFDAAYLRFAAAGICSAAMMTSKIANASDIWWTKLNRYELFAWNEV